MAELDSLNIHITASTKKATDAIDALAKALEGVGDALIPAANGLDSMADALDRIVAYRSDLSETVKALKGLSKISDSLANFGKASTASNDAIAKAKTMSKALKEEYGITGKDAVAKLRESLVSLYSSVGNDAAIGKAINDIENLIRAEGRFATKATETEQKVRDMVRNSRIYLSETDRAEFGDSLIKKMGILGSRNITTDAKDKANDVTSLLRQINSATNQFMGADQDDMHGIFDLETLNTTQAQLEALCRYLEQAGGKLVDFNTAAKQEPDTFNRLNETLNSLANSMGTTYKEAIESLVSAMERAGTAVFERIPELQQMGAAMEEVANVSNPFAGIVEGLQQLENVHPSDALENLKYIKETVSKIGGESGANAANSLSLISDGLKSFEGITIPDFGESLPNFAKGLRSLGSGNIVNAAQALPFVAEGLRSLNGITITADVERIAQLAHAISRFGLANMEKSIAAMPRMATALRELVGSLSQLPNVSENTIRLVEAMSNLNVRSGNASNGVNRLSGSLKNYTGHARNAHKATKSLAAIIGKIYASYWLLFRGISKFGKAITLASDLREVQNVVDVTFADMSDKMNDFAKNAVDTLGMSELTAKQIGSKFQAMGSAMGISKDMVKDTNDFVQTATKGYAEVADSMADVSINLTKLAGDMASFYNVEYEEVAEKLQAVFTGQTRPLRAFGLDLTQATLKEWALKNGIEANMKTMTQAEKTLLRYQYVMANTTAAHSDFERTIGTWSNQIRIAKERIKQLGIVLGQIGIYTFKPLVSAFNNAMKRIIELATATLNSLGKIFGWQVEWEDAGVLRDEEDDAAGLADNMEDAADNAKKFKNFLLGIDELNVLPDDKDKNKGSGDLGGIGAGLGDMEGGLKIKPIEKGFESLYDTLYKLGKRIAEVQKEWLKSIDWDKINKKMRNFGKGFAQFLNGYLSDIELFYQKGRFFAKAFNALAHAIDAFFKEFNGYQFGSDIGMEINGLTSNLDWGVIKSAAYEMAHDITGFINGAVAGINWYDIGRTLAEGINTAVLFVSTLWNETDWMKIGTALGDAVNSLFENLDVEELARMFKGKIQAILDLANNFLEKADFVMIGEQIGKFLKELDLSGFTDDIARLIWNLIKAGFESLGTAFNEAPLDAALVTAFAGAKFLGFGNLLGGSLSSSISTAFAPSLAGYLTTDIGALVSNGGILASAANLGVILASEVVAAFVGYDVGTKIGEALFPEDSMWYGMSIGEVFQEIGENIGYVPDAIEEAAKTSREHLEDMDEAYTTFDHDFQVIAADILTNVDVMADDLDESADRILEKSGLTWGQIKENLKSGELKIDTEGYEQLAIALEASGNSIVDVNNLINELKEAQDNHKTVVDEYVKSHQRERLALERGSTTYEELYKQIEKSRNSYSEVEAVQSRVAKTSSGMAGGLKTTVYEMSRLHDVNKLATHGLIDFSASLDKSKDAGKGIEQVSTGFKSIDDVIKQFSGQLPVTQSNFDALSTGMKTDISGIDVAFKKMFAETQNGGMKTVSWFKTVFAPMFGSSYWNSILSGIPAAFTQAFNLAVNNAKAIWMNFTKWANENMKMKVSSDGEDGKPGKTVNLKFPQYEKGGFPEDGLFLANHSEMVGQFSNGRNAVANNEQIVEGIRQGVYEAVLSAMSASGGGSNVTVEITGDASDIFSAVVKENNRSIMRTGASPIRV